VVSVVGFVAVRIHPTNLFLILTSIASRMDARSIAFYTWGINGDAFTNIIASLCEVFSIENLDALYVVYLRESDKNLKARFPSNVRFISLNVRRASFSVIAFKRFIEKYQPDLIISMPTIINIPAIIAWLWAKRRCPRTKIIISEHAIISYETKVEYRYNLRMRLLPLLAKFLYPKASGVVANNSSVIDDLEKQGIRPNFEKSAIIANPLSLTAINKLAGAVPKHRWLTQKESKIIIGVGRLAKQKNWSLLLHAVAFLKDILDVRLIILGDGPERSFLLKTVKSLGLEGLVDFPGFQENPYAWIAKADILVLPSMEESFGLVLLESMVCGVPVVAVDSIGGGPRLLTDHGKFGSLVPNNVQSLSDAILKLLLDHNFKEELIRSARIHVGSFSVESVTQQWKSLINKL